MSQVLFDVEDFMGSRYPAGSESVKVWLNRLAPGTAEDNGYILLRFLSWLGDNSAKFADYTPDDLIQYQKNAGNGEEYDILDEVQRYIGSLDLRANSLTKNYSGVRSFFLHNRAELPDDASFIIRSDIPPVKLNLTQNIFKRVVMACNECYRAVFTCMFQGGMGVAEILTWSATGYESLIKQLKHDPKQVKIDIPGRKHGKNKDPFFTFVGRDAIAALRVWLKKRPDTLRNGKPNPYIFTTQYGSHPSDEAIRLYWTRKLKRLGYIEKPEEADTGTRYGMAPHALRKLFKMRWRISGADVDVGDWMMGHTEALDKLGYDKSPEHYPEYFEKQYSKAQSHLNVFTENPEMSPRSEVTALRRENRELRLQLQRALAEHEADNKKHDKRLDEFEKQLDETTRMIRELSKKEK